MQIHHLYLLIICWIVPALIIFYLHGLAFMVYCLRNDECEGQSNSRATTVDEEKQLPSSYMAMMQPTVEPLHTLHVPHWSHSSSSLNRLPPPTPLTSSAGTPSNRSSVKSVARLSKPLRISYY
ncbi:hypothetical protein AX17_003508 [Amanita inopinata Kibby_2008]|nr:hypothetical protein AX17_003508 [Amanita inopinata Kibby_2008]